LLNGNIFIKYLELQNNYLKRVPSIKNLTKLEILDLGYQNNQLDFVENYAFAVKITNQAEYDRSSLAVNFFNNPFTTFDNRAFCGYENYYLPKRFEFYISDLNNIIENGKRKCILKQFVNSRVAIFVSKPVSCSIKAFAVSIGINLNVNTEAEDCSVEVFNFNKISLINI
jgi:hypothetical protein